MSSSSKCVVIFSFEGTISGKPVSILKDFGGDDEEGTPVPIPNTAVKLFDADDSWTATSRENM